jgi:hypothetical protein
MPNRRKHITPRWGFVALLALCAALLLLCSAPKPSRAQTEGFIVVEDGSVMQTSNRLTKWTSRRLISNSLLSDDGTNVTFNGASGMRLIFPNFSLADSTALGGHMQLRNAANTAYSKSRMAALLISRSDDSLVFDIGNTADLFGIGSGGLFAFANSTNGAGTKDTSASRASAGVWQFGDGAANANGTVKASRFNFSATVTPSGSADAQGSTGDLRYDDSYLYVKTSAGWKRTALSTF